MFEPWMEDVVVVGGWLSEKVKCMKRVRSNLPLPSPAG